MKNKESRDRISIDLNNINLEGSLGLLALGDVAFEAWRTLKKRHKAADKNSPSEENK